MKINKDLVFRSAAMKRYCRARMGNVMAIKTIEITYECSSADCILYLPAFDDPKFAPTSPPPSESCQRILHSFLR
jgi:hypothetical protein